jgi:dihydrofolate reductase
MITMIAAYDKHRVIGNGQRLPWHLPADLRHFKAMTTGKTIVMGRATFESIGRALPNRRNIVLTHSTAFQAEKVEVVHQLTDILKLAETEEVMIIGGASLYEQFLPYADQLLLTVIDHSFVGDTYFPKWDQNDFELLSQQEGVVDTDNRYPHTFYHYQKR